MAYVMKSHEREFVADILEWSLQSGIQTIGIRAYIQTDPRSVEKGIPHIKTPMFSCEFVHMVDGEWQTEHWEASSIEELRFQMGPTMHEKWDEPMGDVLDVQREVDKDLEDIEYHNTAVGVEDDDWC